MAWTARMACCDAVMAWSSGYGTLMACRHRMASGRHGRHGMARRWHGRHDQTWWWHGTASAWHLVATKYNIDCLFHHAQTNYLSVLKNHWGFHLLWFISERKSDFPSVIARLLSGAEGRGNSYIPNTFCLRWSTILDLSSFFRFSVLNNYENVRKITKTVDFTTSDHG